MQKNPMDAAEEPITRRPISAELLHVQHHLLHSYGCLMYGRVCLQTPHHLANRQMLAFHKSVVEEPTDFHMPLGVLTLRLKAILGLQWHRLCLGRLRNLGQPHLNPLQ
mmetsp:Transcript_9980/g.22255  ORF Transcript_9980/g.22255 Transcript_9980/m.22255 type:complete len:108 (+) Transcript_9980:201-524(+)